LTCGKLSIVDVRRGLNDKEYERMNEGVPASAELLSADQVAEMCGVTSRTIWRWVQLAEFPAPVRLGPQTARWVKSQLLAHIAGLTGQGGAAAVAE
jgi:predicted DNA-binding transcriptional regulator AlpA